MTSSSPPRLQTVAPADTVSADTELRWHTRLIAVLFIIAAILGCLIVMGIAQVEEEASVASFIVCFGQALALIIAAVGILRLSAWGRLFGFVASVPLLILIPFGTALGIYSIIVLRKAKPLFDRARTHGRGSQFSIHTHSVQDDGTPPSEWPFETLLARSVTELQLKSDAHDAAWQFGQAAWSVDQETQTIVFTVPGGMKVTCPVQFVGTYNTEDGTFLWAWDHPSVLPPLQKHARIVKEYGKEHGIERLTTRQVPCTEDEAWEFTALTCMLAQAQGGYRGPSGATLVFMTFGQPQFDR